MPFIDIKAKGLEFLILKRLAQIDDIVNIERQGIKCLQEYIARLISDAVMGQIDVRDIEISKYARTAFAINMDALPPAFAGRRRKKKQFLGEAQPVGNSDRFESRAFDKSHGSFHK